MPPCSLGLFGSMLSNAPHICCCLPVFFIVLKADKRTFCLTYRHIKNKRQAIRTDSKCGLWIFNLCVSFFSKKQKVQNVYGSASAEFFIIYLFL